MLKFHLFEVHGSFPVKNKPQSKEDLRKHTLCMVSKSDDALRFQFSAKTNTVLRAPAQSTGLLIGGDERARTVDLLRVKQAL